VVLEKVLAVVVVAPVRKDPPNSEEASQLLQARTASLTLNHYETMYHLIAGSVADAIRAARLPHESDREAAFSVDEANDPTDCDQSFLLIAWLL
jgi:hypothetical protein